MRLGKTNIAVCEGKEETISCLDGQVIDIVSANYGRTSQGVCVDGNMKNLNCRSDILQKVQKSCRERRICRLRANNAVYGEPCEGTSKYLEVAYVCVNRRTVRGK